MRAWLWQAADLSWLWQGVIVEIIGGIIEVTMIVAALDWLAKRREARRMSALRRVLRTSLRRNIFRVQDRLKTMSAMPTNTELVRRVEYSRVRPGCQ